MSIVSLGYVGVSASDIPAWSRFFMTMGASAREQEDRLLVRVDERDWRISVEQGTSDDVLYVGWEVAGPDELRSLAGTLSALNVEASYQSDLAKKRGVREVLTFKDPEGIQCEAYWGATERTEVPFASPTGVSGFVTGKQGLGHVVFAVKNPEAYETFYGKIGFGVSDYIDIRLDENVVIPVSFMHCNARHHSLAFAPLPSPKKLLHLMLQVQNFDDVGYTLDRVNKAGVELALTLGRHSNDQMVSFYVKTPSGFELEYGWGARCIEPGWTRTRHEVTSAWGHVPPNSTKETINV